MNYLFEPKWRPVFRIVSYWEKRENITGRIIPLRLSRTSYISEETGERKEMYEMRSTQNPLPVKGEFESSYNAIMEFLSDHKFFRTSRREEKTHWNYVIK